MISKLRKKLNNSCSLNKTLTINKKYSHFSYYAEPKQFQLHSVDRKSRPSSIDKAQVLPHRKNTQVLNIKPTNMNIHDNLVKISQNRNKCSRIGKDIHTSLMQKTIKINRMYKETHKFMLIIDQFKWLLYESDRLLINHLRQTKLKPNYQSHAVNVQNISNQFKGLISRFEKIKPQAINRLDQTQNFIQFLKENDQKQNKCSQMNQNISKTTKPQNFHHYKHLPVLIKQDSHGQQYMKNADSEKLITNKFNKTSNELKENINSLNQINHFEKIQILKPQTKIQAERFTRTNSKEIPSNTNSLEKLQSKNVQMQRKQIEKLQMQVQNLKQRISSLEIKNIKYRTVSEKSIQKLKVVTQKLMQNVSQKQKEFQLLKMAQCIKNWQRINEQQQQQEEDEYLISDIEKLNQQKSAKLQEIISLQYDINLLLAQKDHINLKKERQQQSYQDYYRIMMIQACTLQEMGNL